MVCCRSQFKVGTVHGGSGEGAEVSWSYCVGSQQAESEKYEVPPAFLLSIHPRVSVHEMVTAVFKVGLSIIMNLI